MKRKEKEITDITQIEQIISKATVCRLAMSDNNKPYVVPISFGYENNTLYFHSAHEGKKIDILKKNSQVCFELDIYEEFVPGEIACKGTMKFKSVIGYGKASIINADQQKRQALDFIMKQYSDADEFQYSDKSVADCLIIKVDIESMTGKVSGY